MEKIRIRGATPEDREAIQTLTKLLVVDRKEEFDPKRFEWGLLRRLYDPLQRHGLLIAELIGQNVADETFPVGMIFSEIRIDPFGYSEGNIKQFYIRPEYRNLGIGNHLLDTALGHLKKIDVQRIKVNVKIGAGEAVKMYTERQFNPEYTVYSLEIIDKPTDVNEEEIIIEIEKK